MIKNLLTVCFTLLLFLVSNGISHGQTDKLPSKVKQYLYKNYNGWQLVEAPYYDSNGIVQRGNREKGKNFTSGDYDGNGKEDYAIMIEYNNEENEERTPIETFVMMSYENEFEKFSLGGGCRYDCIVSTMPADYEVTEVYTDRKFKLDNPAVVVAFLGKASTAYYYSDDQFKRINTGD